MGQPDVIIIGTGVIGAATAYELAKTGRRVLSLDRNRQIGHGSTAGSCAIIRMHYSTYDGTAFAWEGYHYWRDWADYLGLPNGEELAKFVECGCLVMKTDHNDFLEKHIKNSTLLDCPHEEWGPGEITERLPVYSLESFTPPKRMDQPGFGETNGSSVTGGVYWPKAGYVTDPALSAQNLAAAAAQHGAKTRLGVEVTDILTYSGRVKGVRLADGEEVHAPVVINVCRARISSRQRHGGCDRRDDDQHAAFETGGCSCPRAQGF